MKKFKFKKYSVVVKLSLIILNIPLNAIKTTHYLALFSNFDTILYKYKNCEFTFVRNLNSVIETL